MTIHITPSVKHHVMMVLLSLLTLGLTGCASMFGNQARCPFKDKGGCQSVTTVNRLVDERRFTDNGRFVQPADSASQEVNATDDLTGRDTTPAPGWHVATPFSGQPLRTQEVDARMWVAPWQDQRDAYHGSSYISFVVRKPAWANLPVQAIKNNTDDDRG